MDQQKKNKREIREKNPFITFPFYILARLSRVYVCTHNKENK